MDIVEGWIGKGSIISGSELYWRIGYYIFSWLAIANFYYITEKNIFQRKTKYIFMYSAVGEGIVSIALYFTTSTDSFCPTNFCNNWIFPLWGCPYYSIS